jgi:hypothetical protein
VRFRSPSEPDDFLIEMTDESRIQAIARSLAAG